MEQKLSDRVMALEGPDREIFLAAYAACYPNGGTPWASDACHKERFELLVAKEAWLSAAEMLVPEGCALQVQQRRSHEYFYVYLRDARQHEGWSAKNDSLALALCAAALKARGL